MSRLDRFLVSKSIGDEWENIEVIAESRKYSDHTPLIMKQIERNYGPIPFKFYNSWLQDEECLEVIKKAWEEFNIEGDHLKLYALMKKLKHVKAEIIKWDRNNKQKKEATKKESQKIIDDIDKKMDDGQATDQEIRDRENALSALWKMEQQAHEDNKQKYKNKWCLEGDENTKLFHRNLNKKKRKTGIKGISKDGTWHSDPNHVKQIFFYHFRERFSPTQDDNWDQNLSGIKTLEDQLSQSLEVPISEEEIKKAVWQCGRDKSPGPDGFSIEFVKK